ncbi:MAG: transglutaminase-like domain-containing protein [Muribaculaceae bacterium]|nr:transglutaminase-like domain-containing protein [Roseburia sp.]MCM1430862.1 transglutaminase-like domain-containing protein [Muribaculaceae bacterium]MCM1492841.1 transglutaminase-like domain-containing protein [Muribaculaceae bacterium]
MLYSKKEKNDTIGEQKKYGFSFPMEPVGFSARPAVLCCLKALLIFCASFGTLGGVLSAFHTSYNTALVLCSLLIFSFILAFLHYNAMIFNIVYPLIFFVFTFSIFQCRNIVNSGFQSFVSIMHEAYSDHFDLSLTREVTITYDNQYIAISVAAIFVGFFFALMLNIAISNYMSLFITLLMTFPVLQLALYIEYYPSPIYLFFLLFSYVSIGVLRRSRHFDFPMQKKKRSFFKVQTKEEKTESFRVHSYRSNGPILVQISLLTMAISTLFMAASYSLLVNHNAQQNVSNSLKTKTDEYVKLFVQSGFSGFFDRYAATGGISGGKLGGVSAVRPDYQTDLVVTFAPFSYDTIYLKAFTGGDYNGNAWLAPSPMDSRVETDASDFDFQYYTSSIESLRLEQMLYDGGDNLRAKMKIENIDADSAYLYLPYYTDNSLYKYSVISGICTGSLPTGTGMIVTLYPPTNTGLLTGSLSEEDLTELKSNFPLDTSGEEELFLSVYEENCRALYTDIPAELESTLENIREEIGTADTLEEQALLIQRYFEEEYTYSSNPGTTPLREDFVEYFLNTQKKGYCSHFASAATLLLRSYGYPARYVEGYVVTFGDMANAQAVDEEYYEYLTGENPLGKTGVVRAEITDGNAHAWTEVYKEGFGWIPLEMTPPSSESDATYSDFWSIFSGLFSVSGSATNTTAAELAENGRNRARSFWGSTDFIALPLLLLILCLILVPLLLKLVQTLARYFRMRFAFHRGDYAPMLSYFYNKLLRRLKKIGRLSVSNPAPGEVHTLLLALFSENPRLRGDVPRYMTLLEKGCFSSKGISQKEALWFQRASKRFSKAVKGR